MDSKKNQKALEDLEELESIRAYDDAKLSSDEAIPFEQAIEEIERDRDGERLSARASTRCS